MIVAPRGCKRLNPRRRVPEECPCLLPGIAGVAQSQAAKRPCVGHIYEKEGRDDEVW